MASEQKPSSPSDDKPGNAKPAQPEASAGAEAAKPAKVEEIGGPKGPEPTRYGDWEKGGRCSDF